MKKADWLEKKFKNVHVRLEESETLAGWVDRIAKGSGTKRVKLEITVPVYGEIKPPLDSDELQVLKLNPKYRLFPKVTLSHVRKQKKIADTKARWDKLKRLWNPDGTEVMPGKQESKSMEEKIADESHREVYDPTTKPGMTSRSPRRS